MQIVDSQIHLWENARMSPQHRQIPTYSMDDALQESHSPRIDNWHNYLYIVFHALDLELNRTLDTQELDIFLGLNYLVTIHEEPIRSLDHLWEQCRQGVRANAGPDGLGDECGFHRVDLLRRGNVADRDQDAIAT